MPQGTKNDCAHTFLAKGIDGPALMKLTDEQLQDWNLKVLHATPAPHVGQTATCRLVR